MDENQQPGGSPPDMPSDGGNGGTPPDGQGGNSSSSVTWSGATEITSGGSYSNQTYTSSTANQNALLVDTSANVTLTNPTVTKSGSGESNDNASFYGTNAGVLVKGGSNTTINGGTVTTSANGANGVFSYGGNGGTNGAAGDGTTVVISNTTINTTGDGAGGIMTTGGGVTKASNLTITTTGNSSAPIRTDRGGGSVTVSGGSYTSSGLGSPAIYSTAAVTVENATLTSNLSEGVCIEGQNSVALTNCTLTANNTQTNGNAQFLDAVILYQSQSGDAADGTSTFSMTGGKLVNKSGHLFHVTNTSAVINLNNVDIEDSGSGVLLSVCDDGWSGASNVATLNANGQELTGNILVGDDSTLTLNLTGGTTFNGNVSGVISNNAGTSISTSVGTVNVSLDSASKWYLDGDVYVSSFSGTAANVITNGHTLYVNNSPLSGTTESDDSTDTVTTALNIANTVNHTLINGTSLADSITNSGTRVTIQALDGNDSIVNNVDSSVTAASLGNYIDAGAGDDIIYNHHTYNPTLIGGTGNDSIVVSRGHLTYVDGGAGNDTIIGRTADTTGSDWAMGGYATVLGGTGNDYINTGYANSATVDGGDGNDSIYASGNRITINGGAGNNFIEVLPSSLDANNECANIVLSGNTTVEGFKTGWGNGSDTVYVNAGSDPGVDFKSGGLTFYDGNDTLTLRDVTTTAKVNTYYEASNATGHNVYIARNDWYSVENGDFSLGSGEGLYFVGTSATHNHGVDFSGISRDLNVTLDTAYEANKDSMWIANVYSIRGGAGNTTITGTDDSDTIIAGTGATTINGAGGNDRISLGSAAALVKYKSGDGNDVITGFNENSTLSIGGGLYSSATSGNDVVFTVGSGKVTLQGAASLDAINVDSYSESDLATATSLVGAMLYRTEAGYPIIAGMAFHPNEYHGDEPTNYAAKETWTIESADGLELNAVHYTPENSNDKWAVIIHGYGHNHKHMYPYATNYLANGYNVLMVDQRAAGDSEGSWLTMGTAESADIALWTQEIARRNSDAKITLFGVSMGAATAMLAAARKDTANVTSLIEDCGYSNVVELIDLFNNLVFNQSQEAIDLMPDIAEGLTGYNLRDAAPIDSISSVKVPTLFITGDADTVVATSMLSALYDASGADVKETFIVDGATHGLAGMVDPVGYSNTVFRFIAEADEEGWNTANTTDNISLRGTSYNDTIQNSGSNVTINTGAGNDTIITGGTNGSIDGGDGNNLIRMTDDATGQLIAFSGNTTVENFGTGFGDGTDTIYIAGDPAAVDFKSGGLTFYSDTDNSLSLTLRDVTTTNKVNIYHEQRDMLNKGVFIADNDWYSVESGDLSVRSGEEVYFVGASANPNHGVDFSGISSKLNVTLDTAYIDSEDYVPGTSVWINGVYSIRGGAGNTTITGSARSDTIFAGTGSTTINGAGGNDVISLGSAKALVKYTSGDGNDLISGFNANSTLLIDSGTYSTVTNDNDVIVTVDSGKITLQGAAELDNVNIVDRYDDGGSDDTPTKPVTLLERVTTWLNALRAGSGDSKAISSLEKISALLNSSGAGGNDLSEIVAPTDNALTNNDLNASNIVVSGDEELQQAMAKLADGSSYTGK